MVLQKKQVLLKFATDILNGKTDIKEKDIIKQFKYIYEDVLYDDYFNRVNDYIYSRLINLGYYVFPHNNESAPHMNPKKKSNSPTMRIKSLPTRKRSKSNSPPRIKSVSTRRIKSNSPTMKGGKKSNNKTSKNK